MLMISEGSTDRPKVVALLYVCMLKKNNQKLIIVIASNCCLKLKYAQLESNFNNDKKKKTLMQSESVM